MIHARRIRDAEAVHGGADDASPGAAAEHALRARLAELTARWLAVPTGGTLPTADGRVRFHAGKLGRKYVSVDMAQAAE